MAEKDRKLRGLSGFKWRVHRAKSEDVACNDYETKWRGSNKLFAFTILYLLWRYDDVIVDSGEKAWVYLPVRLEELIAVLVGLYCSCLVLKLKYGDFKQRTPPNLIYSVSEFALSETQHTPDDLLGERDTGTQTYSTHVFKEASLLKKHHSLKIKRLNKQARELRKTLAAQWKDAKRKLDEKNKLLLELQQKLVPLEKETADNLLERDIIEGKLKEEQRRYADLMARIDKVNHKLEAISVCTENLFKDQGKSQLGNCRKEAFGDGDFCPKNGVHADLATNLITEETEYKRCPTATDTVHVTQDVNINAAVSTGETDTPSNTQEVDVAEGAMGEVETQESDSTRLNENKVSTQIAVSTNFRAEEMTGATNGVISTSNADISNAQANITIDGDSQTNKQLDAEQILEEYLPRIDSEDIEIIETYVATSDEVNTTANEDTSLVIDNQQVSVQNEEAYDERQSHVSESYQNQPITEDIEGVNPRDEQSGPSDSNIETIETYAVASDVESTTTDEDTSAVMDNQQVSAQNAEAYDEIQSHVSESYQNQPISEDLEGVNPRDELISPSGTDTQTIETDAAAGDVESTTANEDSSAVMDDQQVSAQNAEAYDEIQSHVSESYQNQPISEDLEGVNPRDELISPSGTDTQTIETDAAAGDVESTTANEDSSAVMDDQQISTQNAEAYDEIQSHVSESYQNQPISEDIEGVNPRDELISPSGTDTVTIDTGAVASHVENTTANEDTIAVMDNQHDSAQNAEAYDERQNHVSESYQNQPISEDLEGVNPREEQTSPPDDVSESLVPVNASKAGQGDQIMVYEEVPMVDNQTPEEMKDFDAGSKASNNLSERPTRVSQLPKPKPVKNKVASRKLESEQPQRVNVDRNMNMGTNTRLNGNRQFYHYNTDMGGWAPYVQGMHGMQLFTLHQAQQQDEFYRIQNGIQQASFQRQRGTDGFTRDWDQEQSFQRGPGWHNKYNGVNGRLDRWR